MNILFVCTGNTCRSPMAEGYLKSRNIPGVAVKSRGLCADGSPVSSLAKEVCLDCGIDISAHISAQMTREDIEWADKIVCMSPSHKAALAQYADQKTFVLSGGIADPFGGDKAVYEKARDEIFYGVDMMFFGFTVTDIKIGDEKEIARLESICFSEPWTEDGILESFSHGTRFFVCRSESELLGYIGASMILDEGYITNIAVFPKHRKKGVGSALLCAVISAAIREGLSFVSLEVRKSNTEAVSLYEKFGFVTEGERKNFYSCPKEDALIMTKRF